MIHGSHVYRTDRRTRTQAGALVLITSEDRRTSRDAGSASGPRGGRRVALSRSVGSRGQGTLVAPAPRSAYSRRPTACQALAPRMGAQMLCAVLLCAMVGFAHSEEDPTPDDGDSDTVNILWPVYLFGLAFSIGMYFYGKNKFGRAQTDASTVIWSAGPTAVVQLPPGRRSARATHCE